MELVNLYVCRDAMEAHFILQVLEDADIQATIMGESLATGRGELPLTPETLPSIWVREDDVERAKGVLQQAVKANREAPGQDQADDPDEAGQPADEDVPVFEDPDKSADAEEPAPTWGIVSRTLGLLVSWAACAGLGYWIVSSLRYGMVELFVPGKEFTEVVTLVLALLVELAGLGIVAAGFYWVTRAYVRALKDKRNAGQG